MDEGLWPFSLRFYDDPQVQAACLSLQDDHGGDVNVALCLLWHGARGAALDAADVARIVASVGPWRSGVVTPLRGLRRALKVVALLPDAQTQEAFRSKLKALELAAEKVEQGVLEAVEVGVATTDRAWTTPEAAAGHNLAAYGRGLVMPLADGIADTLTRRVTQIG